LVTLIFHINPVEKELSYKFKPVATWSLCRNFNQVASKSIGEKYQELSFHKLSCLGLA